MTQFDETKVARADDGKFSAKPPAPEETGVELGHSHSGASCYECGGEMVVGEDGVSNHLTPDGEVDHDADADHVALDDAEFEDPHPDTDEFDPDELASYAANRIPDGEPGQDPALENRLREEEASGIQRCTSCGQLAEDCSCWDEPDEDSCQYCGAHVDDCSNDPCEGRLDARAEDDDDGRYPRSEKSWDNRVEAAFDGTGSDSELEDATGARWTRDGSGSWSTPGREERWTGDRMRQADREPGLGPFVLPGEPR